MKFNSHDWACLFAQIMQRMTGCECTVVPIKYGWMVMRSNPGGEEYVA